MANLQYKLNEAGFLTVDFLDGTGAVIPPPSQYSFVSNNAVFTIGAPVAFNKVAVTCGSTPTTGITVTATCVGINNGTAPVLVDVVTDTETGNVTPGLPNAASFKATAG